MTFFWTTAAGAVDALAIAAVTLITVVFGNRDTRRFSGAIVAVFLANRAGLYWGLPIEALMFSAALADFFAMAGILMAVPDWRSRVIAFAFTAKIAVYIILLFGFVGFGTMAAATTLATWFQLVVILSGIPTHGIFNRLSHSRDIRSSMPRHRTPAGQRVASIRHDKVRPEISSSPARRASGAATLGRSERR